MFFFHFLFSVWSWGHLPQGFVAASNCIALFHLQNAFCFNPCKCLFIKSEKIQPLSRANVLSRLLQRLLGLRACVCARCDFPKLYLMHWGGFITNPFSTSLVICWQQTTVTVSHLASLAFCVFANICCRLNIDFYTFWNTMKNAPLSWIIWGVTGGHSSFFRFLLFESWGEIRAHTRLRECVFNKVFPIDLCF